MRLGPCGQVWREIGGIEQEERAAVAALGKITSRATGVFAPTELIQQQRSAQQIPRRRLQLFAPFVNRGEKTVLVFKAGLCQQNGADGAIVVSARTHDTPCIRDGGAIASASQAAGRERFERMEPTDHHGTRKRAARHLVFGERLVPVVRCICIKIGNCCAQILTRLLLKLHDVAQAVVEGDIGQKGVQ